MALYVQSTFGDTGGGDITNYEPFTTTQPVVGHGIIIPYTVAEATPGTGASVTITDNQTGNTYTTVALSPVAPSSSSAVQIGFVICSSLASVSGAYKLNSATTGGTFEVLGVIETSQAIALDQSSLPTPATSGATTITCTCPGANANADELVIAMLQAHPASAAIGLADPTTGYTRIGLSDPSAEYSFSLAYKETAAIETSSAAWTWTTSSLVTAAIATFKASGGSAPSKNQFFFGANSPSPRHLLAASALAPLGWVIGRRNKLKGRTCG